MDADGSNVIPLTDEDTYAITPSWSPEGSKIAFTSDDGDIWVIDADGGNLTRLAFFTDWNDLWFGFPHAWSTDGSRIAFFSPAEDTASYEIYRIDADEGNLTRLTNTYSDSLFPQWSPDGSKIAFTSEGEDGSAKIRVIPSGRALPTPMQTVTAAPMPAVRPLHIPRLRLPRMKETGQRWLPCTTRRTELTGGATTIG